MQADLQMVEGGIEYLEVGQLRVDLLNQYVNLWTTSCRLGANDQHSAKICLVTPMNHRIKN
jgi:hypothetical protein